MHGKGELVSIAIYLVSAVAVATDLWRGRIYNWLTLPALAAGFGCAAWSGGWTGAADSALGVAAGLLLFGWMFALGAMGGGDVKLLMALGAWGGWHYAVETAITSVLLGGVMAVVMLAVRGRLGGFLRRMYRFLLTVFIRELEVEAPQVDRGQTMPYGVPIAAAACWSAVESPLLRMGVRLWS